MKGSIENNLEKAGILFFLLMGCILAIMLFKLMNFMTQYITFGPSPIDFA